MNKDDLQQQLWELVYDLLSDDDTVALQERIASDPDVARAYDAVKQELELVAQAAKLDTEPISLAAPADERERTTKPLASTKRQWRRSRHAAWLVGLTAAVLLLVTVVLYVRPNSPIRSVAARQAEQDIADRFVRTKISGPSQLTKGIDNYYTVSTTAIDGRPQVADVSYHLYDTRTGELTLQRNDTTNENGKLLVTLPPDKFTSRSRLEIETRQDSETIGKLEAHLGVDEVQHETYLTTDKPLYRPGETVMFRSLTLSRFGLRDDRDLPVQFEIRDPAGTTVPESRHNGITNHGVGNGAFTIDTNRPGGMYTLVATSLDGQFKEAKREFVVRDYRTPRLKKELELTRDSYSPGDEVIADFSARRAEGGPVADAVLQIAAVVDGKAIEIQPANATAAADGTYRIRFNLPDEIEMGSGNLSVVVDDGGTKETISKTIPINLGRVEVAFYPEGGDLVEGIESRVYFHAVDPLGKPVHLNGRIVDQSGDEIAAIETHEKSEGRGSFRIMPKMDESYRLEIDSPEDAEGEFELPAVNEECFVVLDTGAKVFEAGKPIELNVRTTKPVPLVVAAVCRGVHVGQTELEGSQQVTVALPPRADGVIRLTVYDYSQSPPVPVAERLVYRRPLRKLRVQLEGVAEEYSPGEHVKASLLVTDEKDQPMSATLGISVVDDALLNLADDKSPGLVTRFLLAGDIDSPEDLEDANFFLSDEPEAVEALDLLLGTQGWRRFANVDVDKIAQTELREAVIEAMNSDEPMDDKLAEIWTQAGLATPPIVYDNVSKIRQEYQHSIAQFRGSRESTIQFAGTVSFFGALAVIGALAVCLLRRLSAGWRVWVPSLLAATACLIVGGVWMSSVVDSRGQVAMVPFASHLLFENENAVRDMLPVPHYLDDDVQYFAWHDDFDGDGALDYAFEMPEARRFDDWGRFADVNDRFGIEENFAHVKRIPPILQHRALGLVAVEERLAEAQFEKHGNWRFFRGPQVRYRLDGTANAHFLGERDFYGSYENKLRYAAELGDVRRVEELIEAYKAVIEPLRFPVRQYAHTHVSPEEPGVRSDFRETLYWNPLLITDAEGRATIEFDLSDSVTSFHVTSDAHGRGRIGNGHGRLVSRMPFSVEPKLPLEVTAGDRIDVPLAVNNDTSDELSVDLKIQHNDLLSLVDESDRTVVLGAEQRQREHFTFEVVGTRGDAGIDVHGNAGDLSDTVKRSIKVVPPGFPVSQSYAGRIDGSHQFTVVMPDTWVDGSLDVKLAAYPTALADLDKGIDGILREPSGCFEQTSSSNYPNIMALRYMQENDIAGPEITRRAKDLLKRGYGKLVSFECPKRGYEWFGGDPGHEALTAYGLLEFRDMSDVWNVDQGMVTRTAKWLMNRRDGKGGFQRNSRALDSFGSATPEITNAYIVWALTEAGQKGIEKEIAQVVELGNQSNDPYLVALAASSAVNSSHEIATRLLDKLVKLQQDDGHLVGTDGSITRSGGLSLQVETTSLAALSWLKKAKYSAYAAKALDWITKNRQGSGSFGSTQATVLALKALVEHANANRSQITDGDLVLDVNGREVGRRSFVGGVRQAIEIDGVAESFQPGSNELKLELTDDNSMSFSLEVSYRTRRPVSSECPLQLSTRLSNDELKAGDVARLHVELSNTSAKGQPMTVAIVGIPAGLEVRADQLKELQEAGLFDYYEMDAREVVCYWRSLGPDVRDEQKIAFDLELIAEIPGKYEGPASRTYLYYTAEQKHWVDPLQVEIAP